LPIGLGRPPFGDTQCIRTPDRRRGRALAFGGVVTPCLAGARWA